MGDPQRSKDRSARGCGSGCGFGCGSFLFVLIVGGLLAVFATSIGAGLSVRIPFTDSNATLAGSIGQKETAVSVLPGYTQRRVAGNQNLINGTQTLTVGPGEGILVLILGRQPGAPAVDLHLDAR